MTVTSPYHDSEKGGETAQTGEEDVFSGAVREVGG